MLLLLLTLSCLVAASARAPCPAGCACGEVEGEREYECRGAANYTVRALPNDFATVINRGGNFTCDQMSPIPLSNNGTLSSVSTRDCPSNQTRCLIAKLGAADVEKLMLETPVGEFTADQVQGLNVTMLRLFGAEDQTKIPYDVISSLPLLRDFRLRGANITLTEDLEGYPHPPHPSLISMELSTDNIRAVPRGSLRRLAGIKELYIWQNRIDNISADSFIGLQSLQKLDLSQNPLMELPAHVFAHTPQLTTLWLVSTDLTIIRTGALTGLAMMEEVVIKFGENKLTLETRAFAALPSLKKLTIDMTSLNALPADLLEGDTSLQQLTMTSADLQAIPAGMFEGLKSLQTLILNGNKIEALDHDLFWPLKALKELNLDGNKIETLPEQLFSGLTNLQTVSINNNRLTTIASDTFQGATSLQRLSLSNNMLSLAPTVKEGMYYDVETNSPFVALFKMQELDLSGNQFSEIFSDWRMTLIGHLKKLNLSRNNYTELTKADVQFLSNEVVVDLTHNHITTIDLLDAPVGWPEDNQNNKNAAILLDDNPFHCDCQLFSFIRRLRGSKPLAAEPKLDPGEAKCSSPQNLHGRLIKNLTPEDLTCNLLDRECPNNCTCQVRPATLSLELDCEFPPENYPQPSDYGPIETRLTLRNVRSLANLPDHVVFLNLSNTGLTTVPEIPPTVREIDLSSNMLTEPPHHLLMSNVTVSLAHNRFECDCSHTEDVYVLQKNFNKISDAANVTCLGKESPWHIDAARLCDVRRAGILGGALAALGLIAVVITALAYRYSLEIKVFLYSRGWCRLFVEGDELDKGASFDAFVSFSQEDAQWVAEELVPRLENGPRKFKLCLHYRDWIFGELIPAQIARSVEQSRRTIVVLSKSFLKSVWAKLEFRAAHVRAQRERRIRVLVIVLDEVPPMDEMDDELRAYLTTNTYLKVGDPWFWKKLEYALRHRKSYDNKAFVEGDKLTRGALNAQLTADGKIVNGVITPSY